MTPPSSVELAHAEIEHLRADHPDVLDLGTRVRRAADDSLCHGGRGDPHVAPDRDARGLELLDVSPAVA